MKTPTRARWTLAACLLATSSFAAGLEFEVASVRRSPENIADLLASGKVRVGVTIEHGRVDYVGIPILAILQTAFHAQPAQIVGPDWIISELYDIQATIPARIGEDKVPEMLQALLADRFKLSVHRETRNQPAIALTVAKGGLRVKEVPADAEVPAFTLDPADGTSKTEVGLLGGEMIHRNRTSDGGMVLSSPQIGALKLVSKAGGFHLEAPKTTLAGLAMLFTQLARQPVVDLTETKGYYQFVLDVSREEMMAEARSMQGASTDQPGGAAAPAPANSMASAVIAFVQRLGLKADNRKVPMEMIVVDHLEKTPTDN